MQDRAPSNSLAILHPVLAGSIYHSCCAPPMYKHSTAYYDLIYRELKDYRSEAEKVNALLQRLPNTPKSLLDVGCGTGEHARILTESYGYQVDGIDVQPGFVEIAANKLPTSRFEVADMQRFALGRKYDAVLCLFSSIAYTETLEGLESALQSVAQHLEPEGWFLCEPWLSPELWVSGQIDVVTTKDPQTGDSLTRTRTGRTEGRVSVLDIEYTLDGPDGSKSFNETHRLGLFEQREIEDVLESVGLSPIWLDTRLQLESLFIANRPK